MSMERSYFNVRLSLAITNSHIFSAEDYKKLKPTARLITMQLINCIDSDTMILYPSLDHLALACGCDRKQAIRAIEDLKKNQVIYTLKTTYKNRPKNYYYFKDEFLQEINTRLIDRGKKPLFEMLISGNSPEEPVAKCVNISDKMPQKHDSHVIHDYWKGKFNFRSKLQQEFREVILKLSETESEKYWTKKENGAIFETEPWEKRRFLELKLLEQQKKEREEREFRQREEQKQQDEEERRTRENDPKLKRKSAIARISGGWKVNKFKENFFTTERRKEMRNLEITRTDLENYLDSLEKRKLATV